jgi:hypothetical protein
MGYKLTDKIAIAFAALELPSLQGSSVSQASPSAPRPNGYEPK